MSDKDLIHALKRLKVETGSLACYGCGREHSCSARGCAILRAAADRLEALLAENEHLREATKMFDKDTNVPPKREICGNRHGTTAPTAAHG